MTAGGSSSSSSSARARVMKATEAATKALALFEAGPSAAQRTRIAREELEARAMAERIVARAREEARHAAEEVAREAREAEHAKVAALFVALRDAEQRRLDGHHDRIVQIAVALAERLLGASLDLDPSRVAHLARTVIAEARGARRAVIDAHPLDADVLRRHLTTEGLDVRDVEIRDDAALARGELRLYTDVGIIDAKLSPRLDRLAAALRDALR